MTFQRFNVVSRRYDFLEATRHLSCGSFVLTTVVGVVWVYSAPVNPKQWVSIELLLNPASLSMSHLGMSKFFFVMWFLQPDTDILLVTTLNLIQSLVINLLTKYLHYVGLVLLCLNRTTLSIFQLFNESTGNNLRNLLTVAMSLFH